MARSVGIRRYCGIVFSFESSWERIRELFVVPLSYYLPSMMIARRGEACGRALLCGDVISDGVAASCCYAVQCQRQEVRESVNHSLHSHFMIVTPVISTFHIM